MTRGLVVLVAALLATTIAASSAAAAVRAVPAWTVPAVAGSVHGGPRGGVVVIGVDERPTGGARHVVTAYTRAGRRLWSYGRTPGCGNCDDGPQPERRQPDGTFGPIGIEGDDFWAVDAGGREVPGCAGAVTPDGTCYALGSRYDTLTPTLTARAAGVELWSVEDSGYRWYPEFDVPQHLVQDDRGLLYTAEELPTELATGAVLPGRLIAVDPVARSILWSRTGPTGVLLPLASGVLASERGGLIALGPDGGVLWSRPLARGYHTTPSRLALDASRGRLYVGRGGSNRRPSGVTGLDARTGAQLWRSRPRDRARLLSIGASGRVYLAVDRPRATELRALDPRGRVRWRYRTSAAVHGARELAGGRVAVSIAPRRLGRPGRLTLLRTIRP